MGWRKGKKAEEIFAKACSQLMKDNEILGFNFIDKPGKDFIVYFPNMDPLAIEVKSSFAAIFFHHHLKKYATPVIVVPLNKKISKVPLKKEKKLIRRTKREILETRDKFQ